MACWGEHSLHTELLQPDGRRLQRRSWPVASGMAALAAALAGAPFKIRHAAIVMLANVTVPSGALGQTLGLLRVVLLQPAQALALAAPCSAATHGLLGGHSDRVDVLCDLGETAPSLANRAGQSPLALTALLRQPWPLNACRVLGDEICSSDAAKAGQAIATLCGLLALAGHRSILIHGPRALREALADCDWPKGLTRFQVSAPAITWWDAWDRPDACLTGATAYLARYFYAMPSEVCEQIRASYDRLTRTEKRVAEVVLADPAAALETATARLAEAAEVSQPQVIRFCRALGFEGVSSFKRALGASLAVRNAARFGADSGHVDDPFRLTGTFLRARTGSA